MASGRIKFSAVCIACFLFVWYAYPRGSFIKMPYSLRNPLTPSCKIPELNPWDPEVIKVVQPVSLPLNCSRSKPDISYLTKDGMLKFHRDLISEYLTDCDDLLLNNCSYSINCSYSCVRRGKDDGEILFDAPVPVNLENDTKVDCEFPQVNCDNNGTLEYAQVHSQIIVNDSRLEELDQILPVNESSKFHHVIWFIFDSTSRLNFERYCPKTLSLLENLYKAVNFKGLTRHGAGSWDNAIAFFGGKSAKHYSHKVIFEEHWDNWPFIWKNYSQNGYLTLDNEDSVSNIFLYMKYGFLHQPTDHRYRVFWVAASRLYNYSRSDYNDPCCRNDAKHRMQFEYLRRFLTSYNSTQPKFSLFWNTALNHDIEEQLAYLDDDFASFLQKNHELLKNSFLFVMGDHGQRLGRILYGTNVGQFETQMPPLIVSVPEDIRKEQPQLLKNMEQNSKLLISHYDTFVTMHDILASQKHGWGDLSKQKDWTHLEVHVPKPQSYLRPLDLHRTCEQVGIQPSSCICQGQMNYIPKETNDTNALPVGMAILKKLNLIVLIEKQCAQMNLTRVLKLEELSSYSTFEKYKDRKRTFRIQIEVSPSNGTFEGNSRYNGNYGFEIDGEIKRTNRYGNQFHCIAKTNPSIKQYCYCDET